MEFNKHFFQQCVNTINRIDHKKIENIVKILVKLRKKGISIYN